jgi:hypothetical protein
MLRFATVCSFPIHLQEFPSFLVSYCRVWASSSSAPGWISQAGQSWRLGCFKRRPVGGRHVVCVRCQVPDGATLTYEPSQHNTGYRKTYLRLSKRSERRVGGHKLGSPAFDSPPWEWVPWGFSWISHVRSCKSRARVFESCHGHFLLGDTYESLMKYGDQTSC